MVGTVSFDLLSTFFITLTFYIPFLCAARKSISFSDFRMDLREPTFVDKSLFIKDLLEDSGHKIIITAPRGFGKTANLQMLKAFLQIEVDKNGNKITDLKDWTKPIKDTPNYKLFQQLKIMKHKDVVEKHFGKYPVILFDYISVVRFIYFNETQDFFKEILHDAISEHCYLENSTNLYDDEKQFVNNWCADNYMDQEAGSLIPGLEKLAKLLFKHFNRTKVFVLVDHYDSPIYNCVFDADVDRTVFNYVITLVQMLVGIVKDNFYIETMFFTGVSQIEETHPISNNIIKRYNFLNEHRFVPYYGLLEQEVFNILNSYTVEVTKNISNAVHSNYGGYVSMTNITVYNVWAVLQYLHREKMDHVWARRVDIPNLNLVLKAPGIRAQLERLLRGLPTAMTLKRVFSSENLKVLGDFLTHPQKKDHLLYSTLFLTFFFEQGFLTYDPTVKSAISDTRRYLLPNEEVKEYLK